MENINVRIKDSFDKLKLQYEKQYTKTNKRSSRIRRNKNKISRKKKIKTRIKKKTRKRLNTYKR